MSSLPCRASMTAGSPRQVERSCGWQPRRTMSAAWMTSAFFPSWEMVTGIENSESSPSSLLADACVRTQAMKRLGMPSAGDLLLEG